MKKIYLLLACLLHITLTAQTNFLLQPKVVNHQMQSMLLVQKSPINYNCYKPATINKSLLVTYRPKRLPFKFTIKPGLNKAQVATVNMNKIETADWLDSFGDVNLNSIVKYDMRLKFYATKKLKIIVKVLVQKPGPIYSIGWTYII